MTGVWARDVPLNPGRRLAFLREARSLTMHELDDRMGWYKGKTAKLEGGHTAFPLHTIVALANTLACSVEDFLGPRGAWSCSHVVQAVNPHTTPAPRVRRSHRVSHGLLLTRSQVVLLRYAAGQAPERVSVQHSNTARWRAANALAGKGLVSFEVRPMTDGLLRLTDAGRRTAQYLESLPAGRLPPSLLVPNCVTGKVSDRPAEVPVSDDGQMLRGLSSKVFG